MYVIKFHLISSCIFSTVLASFFSDDHAFSLLHWASKEGHVAIADLLLSRGARVNATNMGDDTSLHLAAAHGNREIVVVCSYCLLLLFKLFTVVNIVREFEPFILFVL